MMVKEVDIKHEKGTSKGILYKNKLSFGGAKKINISEKIEVDGKSYGVLSSEYDERDGAWRVNLAMASKQTKEKSDDKPTQGANND